MTERLSLDGDDRYYIAVGRSTTAWALVEMVLDTLAAISFKAMDGKRIQKKAPQNFGRKLEMIRKTFGSHPFGTKYNESVRTLLERAVSLNETRKILVHGAASANVDGTLPFVTLEFSEDGHRVIRHHLSEAEFLSHADACTQLGYELTVLVRELIQTPYLREAQWRQEK